MSEPSLRSDLPIMSYKRPYKKSTTGCVTCKNRKVKCDEQRPVCTQCQKRFSDADCCKYETIRKKNKIVRSESRPLRMSVQLQPHPSNTSESNLLELRLMHHYTKTTSLVASPVMSIPLPWTSIWHLDIPQVAFTSDLVLKALFALSALDLSSRNPEDKTMALASKTYFHKAVTAHRHMVDHDDDESAVPILLTAVLLAHYAWLSAHLPSIPLGQVFNAAQNTFRMCEGIIALTETKPLLVSYKYPRSASKFHNGYPVRYEAFLKSALDDLHILSIRIAEFGNPVYAKTFIAAKNELLGIYYAVAEGLIPTIMLEQKIITYLHGVPRHFVDLIRSNHPPAMALWLRNIVLLELFPGSTTWWIQGSTSCKTALRAAYSIRSLLPEEYLWTTEWPMKVVNREIILEAGEGVHGLSSMF